MILRPDTDDIENGCWVLTTPHIVRMPRSWFGYMSITVLWHRIEKIDAFWTTYVFHPLRPEDV